ncbi:RDD family protein [Nocardia farcinica]|uniref:RDD family protein n=1 Tax=Nocardia farcinica TaxID=37329 RepID=UPI0018930213|nr:RDD family protein [Nocardia farcinica]MBF6444884.1 RDD family protein [Nocardia farcinica]MBF6523040.1 RDD family protein [Nocardia farcinica]
MSYEPAPFIRRLVARIIDLLFALVLTFVIAVPVSIVYAVVVATAGEAQEGVITAACVAFCYFLAYVGLEVFLLIRRDGQTLGKGLLGLRVVPAAEWARPQLSLRAATARMLIIFLPFVFFSLSGSVPESGALDTIALVGLLSLLLSLILAAMPVNGRRALHDLATGSQVVRAEKRKIVWTTDLPMALPGRVDLSKRL